MDKYSMNDQAILFQIGIKLKEIRLEQNITQAQLQDKSGVFRSTISEIENGKNSSLLIIIQLLRAMGRLDMLDSFFVEREISPVEYARMQLAKSKKPRRARATTKANGIQTPTKEVSEW